MARPIRNETDIKRMNNTRLGRNVSPAIIIDPPSMSVDIEKTTILLNTLRSIELAVWPAANIQSLVGVSSNDSKVPLLCESSKNEIVYLIIM